MKKLFLTIVAAMLLLTGCASNVERDDSPGKMANITYDEIQEKIKNKESFVYMLVQTGCPACMATEESLVEYLKDHNVTMYMFNLSEAFRAKNDEDDMELLEQQRKDYFDWYMKTADEDSVYTPTFFVFKDGKLSDFKIGGLNEEGLEQFVVDNELDVLK